MSNGASLRTTLGGLRRDAAALRFSMSCDDPTGALLSTLAASKPGGRLLEIGTGVGEGSAWLLAGMSADARLDTVERERARIAVARRHLGHDPRVHFHEGDAAVFLHACTARYDLIFADTFPGKFTDLDTALNLLAPGGLYLVDDLFPQPNWPEHHQPNVDRLRAELAARADLSVVRLDWSTGLTLCARRS